MYIYIHMYTYIYIYIYIYPRQELPEADSRWGPLTRVELICLTNKQELGQRLGRHHESS